MGIRTALRARRVLGLILALSLAVSDIAVAVPAAAQPTRVTSQQADGETLFRAVFFLQGPLADEINELTRLKSIQGFRKLTPRQESAIAAFQSRLIKQLVATRPTFFQDFEQELRSGDKTRISRALNQAARLSADVLEKADPEVARFVRRHGANVRRSLESAGRSSAAGASPDLKALQKAVPRAVLRDAERLELTWLKGGTGPGGASEPKPDTDHSVALIPYTLFFVVVAAIVVVWLVAPSADSGLLHEQLVGSLASRFGGRR